MTYLNEIRIFLSRQEIFRRPASSIIQFGTKRISLNGFGSWFYFPYRWFIFLPCFIGVTFITMLSIIICGRLFGTAFAGKHVASRWARIIAKLIPISVTFNGNDHIKPGQSYVIVANHQSFCDILMIYGWIGVDFKWVMKKSINKFPLIGRCCRNLDHIFIDRSDPDSAIHTINQAQSQISSGTSVCFFPEGTRSENDCMLPFKKGAFRLAIDLGIPVLPVTLNGAEKILPKNSTRLTPGPVEMIIHPPIQTESYNNDTIKELMDRTRRTIARARFLTF